MTIQQGKGIRWKGYFFLIRTALKKDCLTPVSYTHLDVYKRQTNSLNSYKSNNWSQPERCRRHCRRKESFFPSFFSRNQEKRGQETCEEALKFLERLLKKYSKELRAILTYQKKTFPMKCYLKAEGFSEYWYLCLLYTSRCV